MVAATNDPELQRLKKLADRYRKLGYVVHVYPDDSQLPTFLQGQEVDLIAKGPGEKIVVEVKRARARDSRIKRLADALEGRKGWRLDLDVVGATDVPPTIVGQARSLSDHEIARQIVEARRLARGAAKSAAHLLAWAIAEALMRQSLEKNEITASDRSPTALPKQLYSAGLISKSDYDTLAYAAELRNLAAHGYSIPDTRRFNTESLLRLCERFEHESRATNGVTRR